MPRRPRILLPDNPLHIVQRGINREPCFFAEEYYQCYLHWLEEAARDCGCAIHAYVLMTNHVHLLLTPAMPGAPARLMQSLGRRYVQYANRQYRRTGSLWEERYKSSVVQAESYLLACMRYIELNPVRAAMVADPGGYRWSSYRANGLAQPDARLTPHPLYLGLDADVASRCQAYAQLRAEFVANNHVLTSAMRNRVATAFGIINEDDTLLKADYNLLLGANGALYRALKVASVATDIPQLGSGTAAVKPTEVPHIKIAAEDIDYQLAVITAQAEYRTRVTNIVGDALSLLLSGGVAKTPGTPALSNQTDVVGWEYSGESRRWRHGDSLPTAGNQNTWRSAA